MALKNKTASVKKTECPVTRKQFVDHAKGVPITVEGQTVLLNAKEFSTGSFGWFSNQKVVVKLADGTPVTVQLNINAIVVGSKEAEKE